MMNKKNFLLTRRICGTIACVLVAFCLLTVVGGVFPFRGRETSVFVILDRALEIFSFGRKPLFFCLSCCLFAGLYIFVLIKLIVWLKNIVQSAKKWFASSLDSVVNRRSARMAVNYANKAIGLTILLIVLSCSVREFSLRGTRLHIIVLLLTIQLVMNVFDLLIYNAKIMECIVASASMSMILIAFLMFAFNGGNIQIIEIAESCTQIISALGIDGVEGRFIFYLFFEQVLVPLFHIIVLFSFYRMYSYVNSYEENGEVARKMFVRNMVFLGIIVIFSGYFNGVGNIEDFKTVLLTDGNKALIVFSVLAFFGIIDSCVKTAIPGCYDPAPGEAMIAFPQDEEKEVSSEKAPLAEKRGVEQEALSQNNSD